MKKFKKIIALAMAFTACLTVNTAVMCTSIPTAALTVIDYITDVKLDKEMISPGETAQIELAWAGPSYYVHQSVYFRSDNEDVATVDQSGVITGISPGTATITVIPSNYGSNWNVTIEVVNDGADGFMPEQYNEIKDSSVYFYNYRSDAANVTYTVNTNSAVDYDMEIDGNNGVFTPEEDNGVYILSVEQLIEEIISEGDAHFHYFYPVLEYYTVNVSDGEITMDKSYLSQSFYSQKQIDKVKEQLAEAEDSCFDVYAEGFSDDAYYTTVNEMMPLRSGDYGCKKYISTAYNDYSIKSYFCMNMGYYYNDPSIVPPVHISDESIAEIEDVMEVPSGNECDYVMDLYRVRALKDGKVFINEYDLEVRDGVFRFADTGVTGGIILGDVNCDGVFDISDVVKLQQYLSGKTELSEAGFNCADMNGDHTVNVFDAIAMKRKLLKSVSESISFEMSEIPLTDELREIAGNGNAFKGNEYVITSTKELNAFFDSIYSNYYEDAITEDIIDEYSQTVAEYNKKYNKEYFEKNVLLLKPFVQSVYEEYDIYDVNNSGNVITIEYLHLYLDTDDPVFGDDTALLGLVTVPRSRLYADKIVRWTEPRPQPQYN